jgi:hypothetical protein
MRPYSLSILLHKTNARATSIVLVAIVVALICTFSTVFVPTLAKVLIFHLSDLIAQALIFKLYQIHLFQIK